MGKTRRRDPEVFAAPMREDTGAPFEITRHAAERFQQRIAGLPLGAAWKELNVLAMSARKTGATTRMGDEIWEATDGAPLRFVVKKDGSRRICVTLLDPNLVHRRDDVS